MFNDPFLERKLIEKTVDDKENDNNQSKTIKLFDIYKNQKYSCLYETNYTGKDIKEIFTKILKDTGTYTSDTKLRLIYNGGEIKDEHHLFNHNVKPGGVIQVVVLSEREEGNETGKEVKVEDEK